MEKTRVAANEFAVLIPAYKPDQRFVDITAELIGAGYSVFAVDDGGGENYARFFNDARRLGATVLTHQTNLGKGRALKTGLEALNVSPQKYTGVITADADGQHTASDIDSVANAMRANPDAVVLGVRDFTGNVPFKSRAGNAITCCVYLFATGIRCRDTQSGLRGLPRASWQKMIDIEGDRYEYEMNMLLKLRDINLQLVQVPIKTIYINDNKGSHFNPIKDAWRIYSVIFKFAAASIASFIVDYAVYLLLLRLGAAVWQTYALARIISGCFNFFINRNVVFQKKGGRGAAWRYALLWAGMMAVGALLSHTLSGSIAMAKWVKLPVDMSLFCLSFYIQRRFVFSGKDARAL